MPESAEAMPKAGVKAFARWVGVTTPQVTHIRKALAGLMPELSSYAVVSVVALAVDLLLFNALIYTGTNAATAGIVGYSVGLLVHYVLSRRFVFDTASSDKSDWRRFVEFAISGCVGLAITWSIIHMSTGVAHLPAMVGKIAAVGTSFIVVFLLRRSIVFAGRRAAGEVQIV